jgi:hypothetical protein
MRMDIKKILAAIDAEIERLRQAKDLLQEVEGSEPGGKQKSTAPVPPPYKGRKSRVLSPEARKRIANAQRKRWAAAKKRSGSAGANGGTGDGGYGISPKG